MGTGFTYQGRLIDANNAADGLYDFLFRLYDANVGGSKVGNDVLIADVDVIDGYFTVEMDFGGTVFNGDARWLQTGVRAGELNDPNKYTILRPRQQVTPTPYALYADMLDGLHALDFATVSHNHDLRYYTEAESDLRYVNVTGDAIAGTNIWVLSVENTGTGNGIDGTGQDIAVRGTASAQTGVGVRGNTPGANGYGVFGYASGSLGTGVYGLASNSGNYYNFGGYFEAAGGYGWGVYGEAVGGYGRGVYGVASNSGDYYNYGGYFEAAGGYGRGVYGVATNTGNYANFGGYFKAAGSQGCGVVGLATGSSGIGVYGNGQDYDFYAGGPGTDYGAASSIRWKRDIRPIDEAIGKVMMLRGVYFNWDAEHGGGHGVGMVAEEVGQVLPEIVEYEENGIDATGMDYGKLTPLLVEAVKALKSEVDELREQNKRLEERLVAVEKLMGKQALEVEGGQR
jgi:hypothetical protein